MDNFAGKTSSEEIKDKFEESLLKEQRYGEFVLGENTTKFFLEDPKMMLFRFARYKFVAKMFDGFESAMEVGCQEGLCAQVIQQSVKKVHCTDFYKPFIESCERRIKNPNITFAAHDILDSCTEKKYQGVFALDVFEHIEPEFENILIQNMVKSMHRDGTLILGIPSLESQAYASEPSKIGHVNCKSGKDFKALLQKHFVHVYCFSMNDEVLHTGFFPMSHYLFVVCNTPK